MIWKKKGLIFDLNKQDIPWLKSHAMMPLPLELENKIRIFYTGRHHDGRSRISFFDVDKEFPNKLIYTHDKPLLDVGNIGTFDDCGTVGTFIMHKDDEIWLYYNGYNVRNTVPWSNAIGLAISKDGGNTFQKKFQGPILDRNMYDPYFTISPAILQFDNKWHMWYTSGTGWINVSNRIEPLYNIKYATSKDGFNWDINNTICIEPEHPEECVARASILIEEKKLKMWFSKRGSQDFRDGHDSYELGYAEASLEKPTNWKRMDVKSGLSRGPESYDSGMIAYPGVIEIGNTKHLFYNGNGFGAEGVLWATQRR